tara:strand:+ start:3176 stop:4144 length:969 start_codon:yes stop_codon:yes gene_type:complete
MKKEIIILLILLVSCSNINNQSNLHNPSQILYENTSLFEVYFCPKDNCEDKMINHINKAQKVDCAFYDLNLASLQDSLKNKNTRIIMHHTNKKKANKDLKIKTNNNRALMHNKFCILDNNIILTGSMNPTKNGNTKNNNNLLIIQSHSLAQNYQEEFDEMWQGTYSSGKPTPHPIIFLNNSKIENYFCPEDQCKKKVLELLETPRHTLYFMTFSFTDPHISQKIVDLSKSIEVKGIFEKRRENMKYEQYKFLKNQGVNIKHDTNPHILHHKVFIIDNETIITGSFNPTRSANERNDENILIIHNKLIATKFVEEFNRLWQNT